MAPEQYKIIISDKAKNAMGKLVGYIAVDSPNTAERVKRELLKGIRSLSVFPQRNPFLEGDFIPYNKYHKLVIMKSFLIIYQIQDDKVYVDYIVNCRQAYQWLLR